MIIVIQKCLDNKFSVALKAKTLCYGDAFIYIWIKTCNFKYKNSIRLLRNHCKLVKRARKICFLLVLNGFVCHLNFSSVLFLLVKRRRSRVFLFRKMIMVATRRLTRVTSIATVMTTLSADAIYDNTHINTQTRTSTAQNNDRT